MLTPLTPHKKMKPSDDIFTQVPALAKHHSCEEETDFDNDSPLPHFPHVYNSGSFHDSPSQSSFVSSAASTMYSLDSRLIPTDTSSQSLRSDQLRGGVKLRLAATAGSRDDADDTTAAASARHPASWSSARVSTRYSLLGPGQILPTEEISSGMMVQGPYCITGEVALALKKDIPGKNLIVSVLQCNNITEKVLIIGALQDWYIKLYLRLGDNKCKVKKRKTSVARCVTDPTFNEMFSYTTDFDNLLLEVSLWINRGMFGHNKAIGMALISLNQVKFNDNENCDVSGHYKLLAASR